MLIFLYGLVLTMYMSTGENIALPIQTFVGKLMSLLFNMLSRFFIAFFFPPKEQASFNSVVEVTVHSDFGAQENKICHCFQEVMRLDAMILVSSMLSFKPGLSLSSFTRIKKLFSSSSISAISVVSSPYLKLLIFLFVSHDSSL